MTRDSSRTMTKRGAFIVIEGLDRSGKSTQSSAILARLHENGIPAKLMKFPDRTTPIGKMIDAYLRSQSDLDDRAIHLLFSANRWELATSIQQTLVGSATDPTTDATPTLILADRYAFSGIAFSHAKGLPYTWCRAPEIALPAPDLTLFLDISPEKARERGGYGQERYEKEEMQRKVREVFLRMAGEMGGGTDRRSRWITVDAGRDVEQVTNDIWAAIEPLVHGTSEPLGRLWTSEGDGSG
ncbi:hypothetical protein AX14_001171 [Amanita brunnescens Koide BX004]|nr:hypothetical protein AX14_001171 [Amanita brunnescens Koide BX004]